MRRVAQRLPFGLTEFAQGTSSWVAALRRGLLFFLVVVMTHILNFCGRLLLLWALALVAASPSWAGYSISQRYIFYSAEQRSVSVRITNTGDERKEYSLRSPAWDERTKNSGADLIAYPPVFDLAPGQTQKVRLLLRDKAAFTPPLFFRLVVRESDPVELAEQASSGLTIPLATSFPVYYIDRSVKPKAEGLILRDDAGVSNGLWVRNTGDTLLELRRVIAGDGREFAVDVRVLPGRAHRFTLQDTPPPFVVKIAYGDDLRVERSAVDAAAAKP